MFFSQGSLYLRDLKNIKAMIDNNEYFDGNVKSLGYVNGESNSSVGVMNEGEYEFGTAKPEIMTVIEGELQALLPNESEWKSFKSGEKFNVPGDSKFKVKSVGHTAYLCQYV